MRDGQLLDAWREGDREAGEQLFANHFAQIYRFFSRKIAGDASDLVQRTFLKCVESRDAFRGDSSVRTYLYAMRVVDFGLVRPSTDDGRVTRPPANLLQTGVVLGTPLYMAPEQWLSGAIDSRTDQFGFCAKLLEKRAALATRHCGSRPRCGPRRPTPLHGSTGGIHCVTSRESQPDHEFERLGFELRARLDAALVTWPGNERASAHAENR